MNFFLVFTSVLCFTLTKKGKCFSQVTCVLTIGLWVCLVFVCFLLVLVQTVQMFVLLLSLRKTWMNNYGFWKVTCIF